MSANQRASGVSVEEAYHKSRDQNPDPWAAEYLGHAAGLPVNTQRTAGGEHRTILLALDDSSTMPIQTYTRDYTINLPVLLAIKARNTGKHPPSVSMVYANLSGRYTRWHTAPNGLHLARFVSHLDPALLNGIDHCHRTVIHLELGQN